MQNYKHDLGNKYKNSFKAAALSTMYKRARATNGKYGPVDLSKK